MSRPDEPLELLSIEKSLLAFSVVKSLLEPALKVMKRHGGDDDVKFIAGNFILIAVNSFLDEWNFFCGIREFDGVQETRQIAEPAISKIRRWKGIRTLRNSLLAHPPRGKDGQNSVPDLNDIFGSGQVPLAYAEMIVLGEAAVYAIATVLCRHDDHRLAALRKINPPKPWAVTGALSLKDAHAEVERIRSEIVARDSTLSACFGSGWQLD